MRVRLVACSAMVAAAASGAWERTVESGKGDFTDSPPPHSLAYFQMDPCARPETDRLSASFSCLFGPPSAEEAERRSKTTTELVEIGTINGFTIYDLWYTRHMWGPDRGRDARSVLVQTGDDEFRELQATELNEPPGGIYVPSEALAEESDPLLVVGYHDGGQDSFIL